MHWVGASFRALQRGRVLLRVTWYATAKQTPCRCGRCRRFSAPVQGELAIRLDFKCWQCTEGEGDIKGAPRGCVEQSPANSARASGASR
eukprot:3105752-Amphidinium_carterae.1